MIAGIGIDIVEIKRIEKIYLKFKQSFVKRILTDKEYNEFENKSCNISYLAGRFAAKEAAAKALGTGIAMGVSFKDFEILSEMKKPELVLKGQAKKLSGNIKTWISITHEKNIAAAVVIYER